MGIGIRLRKLWRLKAGVALSLAVALFAAVWAVEKVSLLPPKLEPRSLEMATASTHVLVDTPSSQLIDLRQDTYSVDGLKNRAVLLGNVIASSSVQEKIAARAHVPAELLRIQAPLTAAQPSPPVDSENARHTTDILKSTDQIRVNIKVNTTIPMIDIYAQTPDAKTAAAVADAAVAELKAYLTELAASQNTPDKDQIRLIQLGHATGVVINGSIKWQSAILAFFLAFGIACGSVIFLARVRAGWKSEGLSEPVATES
jgi:hypothetical protein